MRPHGMCISFMQLELRKPTYVRIRIRTCKIILRTRELQSDSLVRSSASRCRRGRRSARPGSWLWSRPPWRSPANSRPSLERHRCLLVSVHVLASTERFSHTFTHAHTRATARTYVVQGCSVSCRVGSWKPEPDTDDAEGSPTRMTRKTARTDTNRHERTTTSDTTQTDTTRH